MAGFETFNRELYKRAAARAVEQCAGLEIFVFTDSDIDSNPVNVLPSTRSLRL